MGHCRSRTMVVLAVLAVVPGLVACSGDDGDPLATDLGDDAVGWCLDVGDEIGAEVDTLPVIDCSEPHTHEVYAVVDSTADVYPGFQALEDEAQVACLGAFEPYVGISPFDSNLFYSWLVPTLASWEDTSLGNDRGDRQIICVAGAADSSLLEGSVKGTRR